MQQHPIPQNITGFEFKLVGFMTLRQFSYIAAAGVLDFTFFITSGGIARWFIIIPISFLAIALAFLPVGGMNFDKWIILFLRSLSRPSKRVWRKEPKQISFLAPQFSRYLRRPPVTTSSPEANKAILEAYLAKVKPEKGVNKLDNLESTRLNLLDFSQKGKLSAIWVQKPQDVKVDKPKVALAETESTPVPLIQALKPHETTPPTRERAPVSSSETKISTTKQPSNRGEVLKEYSGFASDRRGRS